jgi:antirestriction protein ArdC
MNKNNADLIAEAMRGNVLPWHRPPIAPEVATHANSGFPTNAYTNRLYGGINPLLLNLAARKREFKSKYWATYKQWQAIGCKVKNRPDNVPEGEWGTKIVRVEGTAATTISVFNADQVFGRFHLKPAEAYQVLAEGMIRDWKYDAVDEFIQKTGAEIKVGNYKQPRYERVPKDYICMPWRKKFLNDASWYGSNLHELVHWSEWRTGWKGSEAQGELIADMGQGFLEAILGVPHCTDLTNHNKWVGEWLREIGSDPSYIYEAATQAEKSVDFLLGRKSQKE